MSNLVSGRVLLAADERASDPIRSIQKIYICPSWLIRQLQLNIETMFLYFYVIWDDKDDCCWRCVLALYYCQPLLAVEHPSYKQIQLYGLIILIVNPQKKSCPYPSIRVTMQLLILNTQIKCRSIVPLNYFVVHSWNATPFLMLVFRRFYIFGLCNFIKSNEVIVFNHLDVIYYLP